ncbi:putative cell wall-binding protein [Microbacteriaceae bacterium SG_E_30_P1]|uniref:Cell wall-binding protein n=1 Tax=Antiquaquibacter oligotrophicus TaxID=2880260 RepID=A0ABT6KMH8_9MICO|nr:cell wall-binding repeat-containing protein [Antiquaquibacter oligotrophicus]MDH6181205.1 putative cell wall-binding protein [Antiquaquibacter oligotrophicus]UDF13100.1 cell wall-binding repeat-containing protein [Antiquaquibacter oligotrophicus]
MSMTLGVGVLAAVAPAASAADVTDGLLHHFQLDETSGTVIANTGSAGSAFNATLMNAGKAELTGEGIRFNPDDYANALEGGYVDLPDNLTSGLNNFTVDYDIWIDPANVGDHQIWSLGYKTGSCDVAGGTAIFASNTQRIRTAAGNTNVQQNRVRLAEGVWKQVTYTQTLNQNGTSWTGTMYIDGVQHAQATNITVPPSVGGANGSNCNYLARSQNPANYSFRGTLSDFRIYNRAVTPSEVTTLASDANAAGVTADAAAIDLGLTSAIVDDIVLPRLGTEAGSAITWSSSDPSVVEVVVPPAVNSARKVATLGVITRPAQGQPDATAVLTATLTKGSDAQTVRQIPITVKAEFDEQASVDRDTLDLELYKTDDIRGFIDLPDTGEFGSTITWESSSPLVTPTGEVTRPAYGQPNVEATLTATIAKGAASETKEFDVTIVSLPREEENERYFLGYFKGENLPDGEQIMFATSNGNTALDWTGLTGGTPSLVSQLGDQGLRDPHIVRSPDGDTFYMIATDLNWYDQGGYAINDTQYIEVFESHDLVNWTPQRHVKVAPDNAGNAFAPESLWVEETGEYAVFWAQSLWNDPINRTGQGNAQMWYNTTRDFQTFSEPKVWQDPAPNSRIDTTAIKVGEYYYRVTKNETNNSNSDLFSEKHTDFLDSNINNWQLLAPSLGKTTWVANQGYEGPVIFEANPGDTACPGQFYLWGDRYTNGGGYQAACHENIEAPTWEAKAITMTNAGVQRPRHGTVIPITLREWNDIRGIPNEDVATSVEVAVDAQVLEGGVADVSATVTAADTFQTGGEVRFTVGSWSESAFIENGVATVSLPSDLAVGNYDVTAEFLGFEILEASDDSASFSVVPAPDATVDRIAGANRYEVAVNISQEAYPGTAPVVYIANGENYPDALSAGPAAAYEGGPLLLIRPDVIPQVVQDEIQRLDPSKIVVVGGTLSVTEGSFNVLSGLTDEMVRIAGANRFEVSRNVAEYAFGGAEVPLAYVATGEKFPDALSAGGAAGSQDAPVLLVRGSAQDLDADTLALLDDLGTTETRVLGGEASVTPGVFDDLDAVTTATRLGGADRYEAARTINADAFDSAERAFIATGLNFPDALAGSAWAAATSSPLYVVPGTCVTAGVLADLEGLGVSQITLLGGEASLSPAVLNLTPCV